MDFLGDRQRITDFSLRDGFLLDQLRRKDDERERAAAAGAVVVRDDDRAGGFGICPGNLGGGEAGDGADPAAGEGGGDYPSGAERHLP